jgi:hypothetical protein
MLSIGLLTGCIVTGQSGVNPFVKFYQDSTLQMPLANQQRMIPPLARLK